jgi:hypothetical protein
MGLPKELIRLPQRAQAAFLQEFSPQISSQLMERMQGMQGGQQQQPQNMLQQLMPQQQSEQQSLSSMMQQQPSMEDAINQAVWSPMRIQGAQPVFQTQAPGMQQAPQAQPAPFT